jgi:RND family efflux transporter MFP subunit
MVRREGRWRDARRTVRVSALCVGAVLLGGVAATTQPSDQGTFEAVSRPSDHRELAFSVRGKVAEQFVKPGDTLHPGSPVMRLDDTVQRLTVDLARMQAEDTSPVRAARSSLEFREEELKLTESASVNSGNPRDLRQARYERDQAKLKLESTEREESAAQVQLALQRARLDEMTITSPTECVVLEVHKRPGEAVDEQTTVVTVVTIDPLWMDVNIPTRVALGLRMGQEARVSWEDVPGTPDMTGRIIFISPAGHGGARQVQVRLEVPNPLKLPSGVHGLVKFLPLESTGRTGMGD